MFKYRVNMFFFSLEVLVTLTSDVGKVLSTLHKVQPKGDVHFLTGVKKAHVSLAHSYQVLCVESSQ